ncbi:Na+/glucose cotransporter [Longimonas halophila]|uniref:Na+/glucose cotransporter n=1 Tax=Longimonas halophila TaxID=1469170 RepID=A0A2H3P360_9BACT|nr:sodium:solute symporter [Longimonas halophila]PEN08722.1 Na+/glucose cotransporter [Longimonas halophila]
MTPLDWAVVGVYFALLIGIVWWSAMGISTSSDYFLAGRDVGWFAIGASLFASNIGSEHIVGLAGSGALNGMAQAHWELQAWVLVMLAWIFVPFYYRADVFTMPEFLEKRFDGRTRWVLSTVSLVAYVFTKVSVTVYAGALVFETLLPTTFGTPENAFWVGAFSTVILTGLYTVFGGLRAVVYTEVLQTGLLLIGSVFITIFGLYQLGGWGELQATLSQNPERFALWRGLDDPSFPWLGVMIASPIIGVWYWCTDQYVVQRTLAARSLSDAQLGSVWGGFLKVWPIFVFMVPGMIGYAMVQEGMLSIPMGPDGEKINGDMVFPIMVRELLPMGLRGLVVGGVLSALMSSLSSLFNSCATLFTKDIYEKLRPGMSETHLVRVGRIATGVVVGFGLLWIPIMKEMAEGGGGLYDYLQQVQGLLAPPIVSVFVLGLFYDRVNARGAVWGLVAGFVIGMIKLTLQAMAESGALGTEGMLYSIGIFNGYYFTGVLLLISLAIIIGVSLMGEAPKKEKLEFTYGNVTPEERTENRAVGEAAVWASVAVLVLVAAVYIYFSFWLQ